MPNAGGEFNRKASRMANMRVKLSALYGGRSLPAALAETRMKDWNNNEIEIAHSKGGVIVTAHPYYNLIRTGCVPWPPSEIVQKLYLGRIAGT